MAEKNIEEKPEKGTTVITRKLILNSVDTRMARFHIESALNKAGDADKEIVGKREFELHRNLFPDDYEIATYHVTAEMAVKLVIVKKKKEA